MSPSDHLPGPWAQITTGKDLGLPVPTNSKEVTGSASPETRNKTPFPSYSETQTMISNPLPGSGPRAQGEDRAIDHVDNHFHENVNNLAIPVNPEVVNRAKSVPEIRSTVPGPWTRFTTEKNSGLVLPAIGDVVNKMIPENLDNGVFPLHNNIWKNQPPGSPQFTGNPTTSFNAEVVNRPSLSVFISIITIELCTFIYLN
jgi:hypothetical protein